MEKNILILLQNAQMLTLYKPLLAALSDHAVTIWLPPSRQQRLFSLARTQPAHVTLCDEMEVILLNMHRFGVVLTSFAIPCRVHMEQAGLMLEAAHRAGLKVVEVQHGLFQWGHLFEDKKSVLSDPARCGGERGLGKSINISDAYLPWFGEGGIGYPLSGIGDVPVEARGDTVLIATNLHWTIYGAHERRAFFSAVAYAARKYPQKSFLWKAHNGDYELVKHWLRKKKISNISLVPAEDVRSFEDIASGCTQAISMPSTVLLSLEALRKPTAIFRCEGNAELVEKLAKSHAFSDGKTLEAFLAESQKLAASGLLEPFDAGVFRAAVEKHYTETRNPFGNLAVWNAYRLAHDRKGGARVKTWLISLYRRLSRLPLLRGALHWKPLRQWLRARR